MNMSTINQPAETSSDEVIASIYCDGGVLKKNPSPFGGTYAYLFLDAAGQEIGGNRGFVWPKQDHPRYGEMEHNFWFSDLATVSNNVTELAAVVFALQEVPSDFQGALYSDSYVTICRMTAARSWEGVPEALKEAALIQRERHPHVNYVLLDGHPTKDQLKSGVGKRGNPCSIWNVQCDKRCGELSAKFFEVDAT